MSTLTSEAGVAEREKYMRDQQIEAAIVVLHQAMQVRADPVLMTAVRQRLRERRDQLGLVLDNLGG